MELDDILKKKEYCQCTPARSNTCGTCGKKMPFVDTPFGAIPTLSMYKEFYADYENMKKKIQALIEQETTNFKNEIRSEQKKVEGFAQDGIERLELKFEQIADQYKEKADGLFKSFKNDVDRTVTSFLKEREDIASFTYGTHEIMAGFIDFVSKLSSSLFSLLDQYRAEKKLYQDTLGPGLTVVSSSIETLVKILPQAGHELPVRDDITPEDYFVINQQRLSDTEFIKKIMHFHSSSLANVLESPSENQ